MPGSASVVVRAAPSLSPSIGIDLLRVSLVERCGSALPLRRLSTLLCFRGLPAGRSGLLVSCRSLLVGRDSSTCRLPLDAPPRRDDGPRAPAPVCVDSPDEKRARTTIAAAAIRTIATVLIFESFRLVATFAGRATPERTGLHQRREIVGPPENPGSRFQSKVELLAPPIGAHVPVRADAGCAAQDAHSSRLG